MLFIFFKYTGYCSFAITFVNFILVTAGFYYLGNQRLRPGLPGCTVWKETSQVGVAGRPH